MSKKIFGIDVTKLGLQTTNLRSTGEYLCFCPFTKHSKPRGNFNPLTGLFYCFACKSKATAAELARMLGGTIVYTYIDPPLPNLKQTDWIKLNNLPIASANQYLNKRGLVQDTIVEYQIKEDNNGIYFPLFDDKKELIGLQHRRSQPNVDLRYILYGKRPPLYPLEKLNLLEDNEQIVIVEGIFGALKGQQYGVNAFATMGSNIDVEAIHLLQRFKNIFILYDDDLAGYTGATKILLNLPQAQIIIPGLEADEISYKIWQNLEELRKTKSLTQIQSYVNIDDRAVFNGNIKSYVHRRRNETKFL